MKALLIANRGEIALRVMLTASRMGVRTVAIHTDLDDTAPHVRAADDSVRVSSYLDIDAVVAAALHSGADAVHPGYGFLSERAAFARAVTEAGLTFVGPSADVMDAMGRKDAAREIAERAGVPVVPRGEDAAYPVLVKAAAGGGGKGMRVVERAEDLEEAMAAARREAASAFGDDTLLLEKFVERGRHIEVQVMADAHGTVLHLFERDCSTQRRHQKVIEEAPAPTITPAVRELVTSSAVALAREVGYVNAGTVEFLLDTATGEAYFLEMNTRLQVEHPVTEAVTGLDLVELQLRVAGGERLGLSQSDVGCEGHAIEARVYAEDAYAGFLPQAGTAELVRWPDSADRGRARVDAALEQGQVVSTAYDPMLGKVTVHGPDRESARRRLVEALDRTAVIGFTTNVGFLRALAASEEFRDATIDTAWLDRNDLASPSPDDARVVAAWTTAMLTPGDGFRLGGPPAPVRVELDEVLYVDRTAGRVGNGTASHTVTTLSAENHEVQLELDGRRVWALVNAQGSTVDVALEGQWHHFAAPDVFAGAAAAVGDGTITAAMPGTVLSVEVEAGQQVTEGQTLGVLEAMKMELALKAPFAGTVSEVGAAAGRQVALGAVLFVVDPDA